MKITALGTGGWIPTNTRECTSFAVEAHNSLLLLDLGSGVRRLLTCPAVARFSDYDRIYVLLTHFHLDHLQGLTYFPAIFRDKTVNIYGPGRLFGHSTRTVLETLLGYPFFSTPLSRMFCLDEIGELVEGRQMIGDFEVEVRVQDHPGLSVGFLIDERLAFVTDTGCDSQTTDFVRGSELLLHECWHTDPAKSAEHSHLPGVLEIAEAARVKRMGLIHLNPEISNKEYADAVPASVQCTMEIWPMTDLQTLELGPKRACRALKPG